MGTGTHSSLKQRLQGPGVGRHRDGVEMGAGPERHPPRETTPQKVSSQTLSVLLAHQFPLFAKSSCLHNRQVKDAMLAEAGTSRARAWVSPRKRNLAMIRLELGSFFVCEHKEHLKTN